jgi:hypothetical protein
MHCAYYVNNAFSQQVNNAFSQQVNNARKKSLEHGIIGSIQPVSWMCWLSMVGRQSLGTEEQSTSVTAPDLTPEMHYLTQHRPMQSSSQTSLNTELHHSFNGITWVWLLLYAHRHRSIVGAAGHIILTPANQLMVMGFKIWSRSNPSGYRTRDLSITGPTSLPTALTGPIGITWNSSLNLHRLYVYEVNVTAQYKERSFWV